MAHRRQPADNTIRQTVQYFADEETLFENVASFLRDGLAHGEPAVVIATPPHRQGILDRIRHGENGAGPPGAVTALDAAEVLSLFRRGRVLDARLFEQHVGAIVDKAAAARPSDSIVRVYSEMVDLLWKGGEHELATELEGRWHALTLRHRFSVMCGYTMGRFYKEAVGLPATAAAAGLDAAIQTTRRLRDEVGGLLREDRVRHQHPARARTKRTKR